MQAPTLSTSRLILRPATIDDAGELNDFANRNRYHFKLWDPLRDEAYFTTEFQAKLIQETNQATSQVKFYCFRKEQADHIIGEIGISNIVYGVFQNCSIGYKLDENHVGFGYMCEALEVVVDYIFNQLKLHRIEANIIPHNERSVQLIKKLGFRNEGCAQKLLKINGKWEDHIRFALLNERL